MAKYLNLDDVIEQIELEYGYEGMCEDLYRIPTVDAVEVVRCRDCKWDKPDELMSKHWCTRFSGYMEMREDDFCSYGERRCDNG